MESDVKEAIEPESKVDESEKLCHPLMMKWMALF